MLNDLFNPVFLIKIITLIALASYFIFSLVVLNQVRVMNRVETIPPLSSILLLAAIIHIALVFSLFLTALGIL